MTVIRSRGAFRLERSLLGKVGVGLRNATGELNTSGEGLGGTLWLATCLVIISFDLASASIVSKEKAAILIAKHPVEKCNPPWRKRPGNHRF